MNKLLFLIIKFHRKITFWLNFFYLKNSIGQYQNPLRIYGTNIQIVNPENLTLGNNVALNNNVYINATYPIQIGNYVAISDGAKIISVTLDYNRNLMSQGENGGHIGGGIVIGNNVQIGANAIILPRITIGDNVVVGAGSVVTKNIDSNLIVAGIPAKPIKFL